MAFIKVEENPYSSDLVDLTRLTDETFNPRDYIDFSTNIRIKHDSLESLAKVGGISVQGESIKRIMSDHVDRATGEVYEPDREPENVVCSKIEKGDILFHKYAGRIGRIGIAEFDGLADNHFIPIKPLTIKGYYLLLALRSLPVLLQLPYRETARPGVWNDDLNKLRIPRLDSLEGEIDSFIRDVFRLRKRAETILKDLLNSFDFAISSKMPTDYSFFMEFKELSEETLEPGYYFMKAIEMMFPEHIVLGNEVDIIYPSSLNAGDKYTAVTLSDYSFEGIVPQNLKGVKRLWRKNFASPGDLILNRLHSSGDKKAKATVILLKIDYLGDTGLTLDHSEGKLEIPIYDQLFILKMKKSSKISPYYLSMVLNSDLFQRMFEFMMSGSTGRQRLRKTKLVLVRLPILAEHMMRAFSEATKISMEVLSESLRILIRLHQAYEKVVYGKENPNIISTLIREERDVIKELKGNAIEEAQGLALTTSKLEYEIKYPSLT